MKAPSLSTTNTIHLSLSFSFSHYRVYMHATQKKKYYFNIAFFYNDRVVLYISSSFKNSCCCLCWYIYINVWIFVLCKNSNTCIWFESLEFEINWNIFCYSLRKEIIELKRNKIIIFQSKDLDWNCATLKLFNFSQHSELKYFKQLFFVLWFLNWK